MVSYHKSQPKALLSSLTNNGLLFFSSRQTLDRAASQKIPMKKMRTIFKKYLDFEEKYGDDDGVKKVKLLAASYVDKEVNA